MLPFPLSLTRHANTGWKPMAETTGLDDETLGVGADWVIKINDGPKELLRLDPGFEWPTFLLVFSVSFAVMVAVALAMI